MFLSVWNNNYIYFIKLILIIYTTILLVDIVVNGQTADLCIMEVKRQDWQIC